MTFWDWLNKNTSEILVTLFFLVLFGVPVLTMCAVNLLRAYRGEEECDNHEEDAGDP